MIAFPLILAACSATTPEQSDVSIYGGTQVDGNEWGAAVGLLMGGSLCTGTLVTPTLVITAAHCLDSRPASVTVVVGNKIQGGRTFRAASYAINPDYRDNAVTDIAYVKLAEPVSGVELIPVATDAAEIRTLLNPGYASTMVGFGQTENGTVGTKFQTTTVVGRDQDGALFVGGNGKDSCQGDSGGPAFGQLPNGQWRVYGITSRGNGCGGGGLLARMHDGLCWIQKDSGIAIPGSKLRCDGVVNIPDGSTKLNLLLTEGATATPDSVASAIAASPDVASVKLCLGTVAQCVDANRTSIAYTKTTTRGDRTFFVSQANLDLAAGKEAVLQAFDATGLLIAKSPVRFDRP